MSSKIWQSPLPYLALIIAHIIWGLNFVIAKVTLQEIPPMSLAFLRYFLAFLLILPFILTTKKKQVKKKRQHLIKLISASFFMTVFNILLFYEGLKRTSSIDASVLSLSVPILSILAGWWVLKEKVYLVNVAGVIAGFLGSIIIIGLPIFLLGSANLEVLLGNGLIILSCIAFVIGVILAKELLDEYPPLTFTFLMFLIASVTFFIPALIEYTDNPGWINNVTIIGFLGLLYITILSSVCAFFLLNWGMQKIGVVQANLFQYIEPAVTATLAVPLLGERISFSFIIGTCLVVLGVYWGTLGKLTHHHLHYKHHRS